MIKVDRPRRAVKRRKPLAEIDAAHLERIDELKRARNRDPHDTDAQAAHENALAEWHAFRRQVVHDFLFALRITMTDPVVGEPLIASNILDGKYPTAFEREICIDLARIKAESEEHAKAIAEMEARRG